MYKCQIKNLCVALALAMPLVALAEEAATLETVNVTAVAMRQDIDENSNLNPFRLPRSSSSNVQVITREEIEQLHPADAFELLNMASGVVAAPKSSRMSFSTLTIRGDSNFRWMIDGAYLDSTTGARIMQSIPMSAVEEIKIVRGSTALTMGPLTNTENPSGGAAVNGFIVVRTKRPSKSEAQMRASFESNNGQEQSVWLGKKLQGEDASGYLAALVAHNENGSPSEKLLGTTNSYNVDRRFDKGLLRGGVEWAGWQLDLMQYEDYGYFQIPNPNIHYPGGSLNWSVNPSHTRISALTGSRTWSASQATLISVSRVHSDQVVQSLPTQPPYTPNVSNATHTNIRHNIDLDFARFSLGGDYRRWEAPLGQNPAYYAGIPRSEQTTGWFAQGETKLIDGKLDIDGSYREDSVFEVQGLNFMFSGTGVPKTFVAKTAVNNVQLPKAKFLSMGGRYSISDRFALTSRYGQGSQPVLPGMMAAPGVILLDDSQSKIELGLEGSLMREFNPSLNYFYKSSKNEKSIAGFVAPGFACNAAAPNAMSVSPTNTKFNPCYKQSDTTRSGVELSVNGSYSDRSNYRFGWTHFLNLSGLQNTAPLEIITPHDIAELFVSHGIDRYTISGSVKYVSSYYGTSNGAAAPSPWSGYTRFDLGFGYDWRIASTPVRTTIYGRNLTDSKYETVLGIQDVGRVIGFEVLANF